jgi:PAS domain S-box-containing protein
MSAGPTPLPSPCDGQLQPGDHVICLCDDITPTQAVRHCWSLPALDAGDRVVFISDEDTNALAEAAVNHGRLSAYLKTGGLIHRSSHAVLYPTGAFEPDLALIQIQQLATEAEQDGYPSLHLMTDMSWASLALQGAEQLAAFETQLDSLLPELNVAALCLYDRSLFRPARLLHLLSLHPKIALDGRVIQNFYYLPPSERLGEGADRLMLDQRLQVLRSYHEDKESLLSERNLLRTLIDNLPAAVFVKDADSRFLIANALSAQENGISSYEEMIGLDDTAFLPPELAETYRDDDLRVLTTGVPIVGLEEPAPRIANDSAEWYSTTKVPLRDTDGNVIGIVGISWDISRRRQAEEALRCAYDEMEQRVAQRTLELTLLTQTLQTEVVERQQVEEELTRERTLLRTLIDALPDAIYAKDREGRYVLCNPANASILGADSPDETIGKTAADVYEPDLAEQFRIHDEAVLASGQPLLNMEQLVVDRTSGREFWQLTSKVPLRDAQGKITGVIGIGRDVDRRKRSETLLRQAEQEKEAILDNIKAHITLYDRDMRILWANLPSAHNQNMSREEIIGQLCYEVVYGRESPCPDCPVLQAIESSSPAEVQRHTEDGRVWFIRGFPYVDVEGHIIGGIEISLEITEHYQAEAALRQEQNFTARIFETAPAILLVLDTEGRILRFNPFLEKLTGYAAEEVLGRDWFDIFIPEETRERARALLPGWLRQQQQIGHNINPILTRSGEERIVEWRNQRLLDADGSPIGVLGIGQDVTERLQAETALREQRDLVENMFDAAPVILALLDTEGRLLRGNRYLEEVSGWPLEEIVGKEWLQRFIPEHTREEVRPYVPLSMEIDQPESNVTPLLTRDGAERLIEWHNRRLFDDEGKVLGLLGIGQDVTAQRAAEQALRGERDFVERIFETAPVILALLDTEGRLLRGNRYLEEISGYSVEEVVGQDWVETFIPQRLRAEKRARVPWSMQVGQTETNITPLLTRSGSERMVEWYNRRLFDAKGEVQGLLGIGQDVTDRLRAASALREERDFVERIFEAAPVILIVLDTEGRIIRFNQYLETVSGYSLEEIKGKDWLKVFAPAEEETRLRALLQHTLEVGEQMGNTNPLRTRTGEERLIEWYDRRLSDDGGNTIGILGIGMDVTERRRAERALAESQERLARVFRLNPLPLVATYVEDGTIIEVNDAAERFVGFSRQEMLGRTTVELGIIDATSREELLQKTRIHQKTWIHEMPFYTSDGRRRIGIFHGEMAEIDGKRCIVQAVDDITERKEGEEKLAYRLQAETLVAALSTHFINVASEEVDREIEQALARVGRFTNTDRAYLMLVAKTSPAPTTGKEDTALAPIVTHMYEWCAEGIPSFAKEAVNSPLDGFSWTMTQLQRGQTVYVPDIRTLPPEAAGERQVWPRGGLKSTIGIPLMRDNCLYAILGLDSLCEYRTWEEADVNLVRVVGEILFNVLTRRQAEQEILSAERLAALGRLMASIAHEINNPLQIIQSHLELVLDFPLSETERLEYLSVMRAQTARLTGILHNVLGYARAQPGDTGGTHIAAVVNRVLALVRKELEQQRVQVDVSVGTLPLVAVSANRLEQICLNLSLNAMEAMQGMAGGTLSIHAQEQDGQVHLTFTNTGPPISDEAMSHIFEPFYSTKTSGSGLGLWISYSLLGSDGTLSAHNLEGEDGVAFTLALNRYSGEMVRALPKPVS